MSKNNFDLLADLIEGRTASADRYNLLQRDIGSVRNPDANETRELAKYEAEMASFDSEIAELSKETTANKRSAEIIAASNAYADGVGITAVGSIDDERAFAIGEALGFFTPQQSRVLNLSDAGVMESRDWLTSSTGVSLLKEFAGKANNALVLGSPVTDAMRRVTVDHSNIVEYSKLVSFGTATITAEGASIAESPGVLGTIQLDSFKVARFEEASAEYLSGQQAGVEQILTDMITSLGVAIDGYAVTGTGSGQPTGFKTALSAVTTPALIGALTGDQILDAVAAIPQAYRRGGDCKFVLSSATMASIRQLKDGNSNYLLQSGLALGQPDKLVGYDVIISDDVEEFGASKFIGYFADFSRQIIRISPVKVDSSPLPAYQRDVLSLRALVNFDVHIDTASAVAIKCAAS